VSATVPDSIAVQATNSNVKIEDRKVRTPYHLLIKPTSFRYPRRHRLLLVAAELLPGVVDRSSEARANSP